MPRSKARTRSYRRWSKQPWVTWVRTGSRGWPVLLGFHVLPGLLATLLMPAIGLAVDRWGPRRIITTGMIVLAGALLLSLGAQTDGIMLLTAATVGVGGALASWVPVATAINNWFHRRRAFAMASGFVLWAIASAPLWLASPAAGYLDDQAGIPAPVTIAALVCVLIWPSQENNEGPSGTLRTDAVRAGSETAGPGPAGLAMARSSDVTNLLASDLGWTLRKI